MRRLSPAALQLLAAALLAGCSAAHDTMAESAARCALILLTADDWPSTSGLASELGRRSTLPVRSVRAISSRLFAVTLEAPDAAACSRAMDQLAADKSFAASVEPDRRRFLPRRPGESSAQ